MHPGDEHRIFVEVYAAMTVRLPDNLNMHFVEEYVIGSEAAYPASVVAMFRNYLLFLSWTERVNLSGIVVIGCKIQQNHCGCHHVASAVVARAAGWRMRKHRKVFRRGLSY